MNPESSHLETPIPTGLRGEWADFLAQPPVEKASGNRQKIFVVRLGSEWFGLPPTMLVATQPDARPSRLPHRTNSTIEGLVNADGRVIICLAFEHIFGVLPGESGTEAPRLLVFQTKGWLFATRVRQVLGIEEVNFDQLQPLGESASENLRRSARGIIVQNGRAITCLDAEMLVNHLTSLVR